MPHKHCRVIVIRSNGGVEVLGRREYSVPLCPFWCCFFTYFLNGRTRWFCHFSLFQVQLVLLLREPLRSQKFIDICSFSLQLKAFHYSTLFFIASNSQLFGPKIYQMYDPRMHKNDIVLCFQIPWGRCCEVCMWPNESGRSFEQALQVPRRMKG